MNRAEKVKYVQLLEEKVKRSKENQLHRIYQSFYGWQRAFLTATKEYQSCALLGGNRVGKTRTGLAIDAFHLRGDYPEEWEGRRFDHPPLCWLLGYSGEKTRDLLQHKLFGRFLEGKFEGGLIPADRILDYKSMTGTSGAMREVRVKHIKGISVCQFWSYSQGQWALMGDNVDWYHFDEEPRDQAIYPQVVTRTLTADKGKGGSGILTLTPENGKTELVCKFMGETTEEDEEYPLDQSGMYLQTATWDQCPHLDEEAKKKILSIYPAHQRDMRSKGVPLMGAGLIYLVNEEQVKFDPFDYPPYWFVINGMDFGWGHPQAHVQLVWDRDSDVFYVVNAWKGSKKQPFEAWHVVKPWATNVPTAWPADGLQTEKGSAKKQKAYYEEEGFDLLPEHAQWEDGGNGVWAGIMEIQNLLDTGRLKIAAPLFEVFEEFRQYHTKTTPSGKSEIVKIKDDLLDALRYAYMMRRYAIRIMDRFPPDSVYKPKRDTGRDTRTGY